MSQQIDIRVLEGVAKRFELELRAASGAPLPAAEWQLGGGAENSSGDKVDATVVEFADGRAVLQLPPLTLGPQKVCKPRREPWGYQLRATQLVTGRVYVLLQGELTVDPWYGATEPSNGMVDAARVAADAALEDAEVVTGTITMGIAGPRGEQGPKGDKGDPGAALTYADLTEEQKAELIAPLGYDAEADVSPEGSEEDNYNGYGFGFVMPRAGRIKGLTLECRDAGSATPADMPIWLKVWRGTTLIARSDQGQQHAPAAVLSYTFAEPFAVLEGEEIKVSFHSEDGMGTTAFQMGRQCCLRVVAKDSATPGGILNSSGGYEQSSWVAKHTWHMLVERFAPAAHVEDNTVHITEAERTTWNEAAAREVPEAYTLTAEEVRAVVPIAWQGTGTMPRIVVGAVAFGLSASAKGAYSVAVGYEASVQEDYGVALGYNATVRAEGAVAVGEVAVCDGKRSVAIGHFAKSRDDDLIVMSVGATTGGSIRTHFCFMGQGSPLANTYEGGEACMGYVVADGDGNIITSGTRKLSELFTNNVGTFCPTGFVLPS